MKLQNIRETSLAVPSCTFTYPVKCKHMVTLSHGFIAVCWSFYINLKLTKIF